MSTSFTFFDLSFLGGLASIGGGSEEINVPLNSRLHLSYRVSSETDYDFFRIQVTRPNNTVDEGVPVSGNTVWQDYNSVFAFVTSGIHTVRFRYYKDSSSSEGSDTAWVDKIIISNGGTPAASTMFYYQQDFESGIPSNWTQGTPYGWQINTVDVLHGTKNLKAATISDDQEAWIEFDVNVT
jgi:hypothetical protein